MSLLKRGLQGVLALRWQNRTVLCFSEKFGAKSFKTFEHLDGGSAYTSHFFLTWQSPLSSPSLRGSESEPDPQICVIEWYQESLFTSMGRVGQNGSRGKATLSLWRYQRKGLFPMVLARCVGPCLSGGVKGNSVWKRMVKECRFMAHWRVVPSLRCKGPVVLGNLEFFRFWKIIWDKYVIMVTLVVSHYQASISAIKCMLISTKWD